MQTTDLIGKPAFNKARLFAIRERMKDQDWNLIDLNSKVFPDVSYNRVKNIFQSPYHISDENLILMERALGISKIDIQGVLEVHGLSLDAALNVGVKI